MSDGLSRWWPTPSRPGDHFSAGDLARSVRWHRPLHRLGATTRAVEVAALVAIGLVLGRVAGPDGGSTPLAGTWPRALLGSTLTVGALRLPGLLAEWWVDGLVDGDIDHEEGPQRQLARFLVAASAGTAVQVAALTIVAAVAVPRLGGGPVPWILAAMLAVVGLAMALVDAVARGREAADGPEGDDATGSWAGDLAGLARRHGVDPVRFALVDEGGPNACAVGFGSRRQVLVDRSLVNGPTSIRDFVVAHELTHLARHHPVIRAALGAVAALTVLLAPVVLAPGGRPWSWFGLRPDDPLSVPVTALVVLGAVAVVSAPIAWVLRALERSADAGAVATVGPLDQAVAVELHLASGVELDPPLLTRLTAHHPGPAERVEMIARRHRNPRKQGANAQP